MVYNHIHKYYSIHSYLSSHHFCQNFKYYFESYYIIHSIRETRSIYLIHIVIHTVYVIIWYIITFIDITLYIVIIADNISMSNFWKYFNNNIIIHSIHSYLSSHHFCQNYFKNSIFSIFNTIQYLNTIQNSDKFFILF